MGEQVQQVNLFQVVLYPNAKKEVKIIDFKQSLISQDL
jgi:hypothetical protein